ncbi:MAG: hypothetical protein LUJ09_07120 [Firmicutes bacterium]|nr:hypothetical protein [Bacillota bacterium]
MEHSLQFSFAGVGVRLVSSRPLSVSPGLLRFLAPPCAGVTISVRPLQEGFPPAGASPCGDDMHFCYYRWGDRFCAVAKPGRDGSVSTAVFTDDFSEATLYTNDVCFPNAVTTADKALALFPLRQILLRYGAVTLHSSRIYTQGRAIVFSAPSQTGKTTQAGLWQRYAGAEIVSNDRSLLRQEDGALYTYGFPIDGSSPVYHNGRIPLGAVVMLAQGAENQVERLRPMEAVRCLMGQTAMLPLSPPGQLAQFWLTLTEGYPVYRLTCRPDAQAVACLKDRLNRDGVI